MRRIGISFFGRRRAQIIRIFKFIMMMLSVFIRQRRINLRKPARHREPLRRDRRVCDLFSLIIAG